MRVSRSSPYLGIRDWTAAWLVLAAIAGAGCSDSPVDTFPGQLAAGTWGGDRAGVIVSAELTHVHVGCTSGDFPAGIELDTEGRFSVPGDYLVRAYPVATGPTMPARFAGVVRGRTLTLTVAVNDTIDNRLVVFGPVSVTLGQEPRMGPCPICERPGERDGPG